MAKKTGNPDNIYTFRIMGTDIKCEASLGASDTYKNEFIGKLDAPYTGILETDLAVLYRRTLPLVTVAADEDGNPVTGADGTYDEVPSDFDGPTVNVRNPDYYGNDMVGALRFVWAMARAAGSVGEHWDAWGKRVLSSPMGMRAQKRLFDKALYEVALTHYFLDPEGPVGAEEQDS